MESAKNILIIFTLFTMGTSHHQSLASEGQKKEMAALIAKETASCSKYYSDVLSSMPEYFKPTTPSQIAQAIQNNSELVGYVIGASFIGTSLSYVGYLYGNSLIDDGKVLMSDLLKADGSKTEIAKVMSGFKGAKISSLAAEIGKEVPASSFVHTPASGYLLGKPFNWYLDQQGILEETFTKKELAQMIENESAHIIQNGETVKTASVATGVASASVFLPLLLATLAEQTYVSAQEPLHTKVMDNPELLLSPKSVQGSWGQICRAQYQHPKEFEVAKKRLKVYLENSIHAKSALDRQIAVQDEINRRNDKANNDATVKNKGPVIAPAESTKVNYSATAEYHNIKKVQ